MRTDTADGQYIVNWNTGQCITGPCTLNPSLTYRIQILELSTVLGFADVQVVTNASQLKNVNTAEYIGLVDGRTLPIKFRIEQGALAVVGATGGAAALADGAVTLSFAANAVPGPIAVTATPVQAGGAASPHGGVLPGTLFEFEPSPTTFSAPVSLTLQYPATLPPRTKASRLALCKMSNGACVPLPHSTVDSIDHTVTASISTFSDYGVTTFPEVLYWSQAASGWFLSTDTGQVSVPIQGAQDAGPEFSPDGSRIAYFGVGVGVGSGPAQLRIINSDGTNDHAIAGVGGNPPTVGYSFASCLAWSPDGTRVMIVDGGPTIVNADGSGIQTFSLGTTCGQAQWSPDGSKVEYLASTPGAPDSTSLFEMNADGTGGALITRAEPQGNGFILLAGWSADRTMYAYLDPNIYTAAGFYMGMYIQRADGTKVLPFAEPVPYGWDAFEDSWSPVPGDNRLLLYAGGGAGDPAGLFIVGADGTTVLILPFGGSTAGGDMPLAGWSPDGTRVYFYSVSFGVPQGELHPGAPCNTYSWMVNNDGSGLQPLVAADCSASYPVWRP